MGEPKLSCLNFMGLNIDVFKEVYPPQEDSFLLAKHIHSLEGNVLELGTGCGISSLSNASRNPSNYVLGVDINPYSVKNASYNARHNRIKNAHFMHSDMFSSVPKLRFDAILFNPPYLPEEERPSGPTMLDSALYSGKDGRRHTDIFLDNLEDYLLPGGSAFIVQSSLTDIPKTIGRASRMGIASEIIEEQPLFFEKLALLKLFRE
ncbi:methyltransferase [Candidatus Micrarchaeota archaeon]|nr:methyltransferase [Candidatus Micrarchaeota archaeon]MBD3417764.1 methyltransferase [Candidatus Micrarchaeota archaeon]